MLKRFDDSSAREAKLRYLDGDFQVISPGVMVRCAVSGEAIPLDELRYWSVARQEAYATAEISLEQELKMNPGLRKRG